MNSLGSLNRDQILGVLHAIEAAWRPERDSYLRNETVRAGNGSGGTGAWPATTSPSFTVSTPEPRRGRPKGSRNKASRNAMGGLAKPKLKLSPTSLRARRRQGRYLGLLNRVRHSKDLTRAEQAALVMKVKSAMAADVGVPGAIKILEAGLA